MIGESSKQGAKNKEWFKCHSHGHNVALCLVRNLLVEGAKFDREEFMEIYEVIGNASDVDKNVSISNI